MLTERSNENCTIFRQRQSPTTIEIRSKCENFVPWEKVCTGQLRIFSAPANSSRAVARATVANAQNLARNAARTCSRCFFCVIQCVCARPHVSCVGFAISPSSAAVCVRGCRWACELLFVISNIWWWLLCPSIVRRTPECAFHVLHPTSNFRPFSHFFPLSVGHVSDYLLVSVRTRITQMHEEMCSVTNRARNDEKEGNNNDWIQRTKENRASRR